MHKLRSFRCATPVLAYFGVGWSDLQRYVAAQIEWEVRGKREMGNGKWDGERLISW